MRKVNTYCIANPILCTLNKEPVNNTYCIASPILYTLNKEPVNNGCETKVLYSLAFSLFFLQQHF